VKALPLSDNSTACGAYKTHFARAISETLGGGELKLSSCETAHGVPEAAFIAALTRASGANVSASTGLVGAATKGGQWELDAQISSAVRAPLTPTGIANYTGVMNQNIGAGVGFD
jgi:hypothetical protein